MIKERKKKKEEDGKRFEVSKPNPKPHFSRLWVGENPNLNKNVFIGCSKLFDWLWSSNKEFLYKENVGFLGEMLSKFFQNPCFCFGHNLAITHPN